ncbi:MAG: TonB-dependent receptor [Gammaproteobacteria bacterium]|nr:TonB-dependent receptor [Gammaproteobacteria bacterium]
MRTFHTIRRVALTVATATAFTGVHAAQLEEIVVTAQKRTESLQDIPISITTISGDKIEQAGIGNLEDLSAYVPNLMLSENAVATSIIMRGIGPGANQSFEQSVGLYVDGIHLAKGRQTRTGLFDLERVEVLRGPQGILFGKNTLAGAVNVTSATPQVGDEFGGKISVGFESHDGHTVEGNLNGSVSENLALRLAFKDHENDGYLPNSITGQDGPTTDETLWRFAATWEPSDNTSVKFKHAEGEHTRVGGTAVVKTLQPVANLGAAAQLAFGVIGGFFPSVGSNVAQGILDLNRDAVSIGGNALAASLGEATVPGEKPEGTDTENKDTSLNIDVDFGDGYTFTSVTGYSEYEYEDGIDTDFLPIQFVGRSDISEYDQISQEFRITSDPSRKFSYIAGAYWEEQTQEIDRIVVFDGTLGLPAPVMTAIIGAPSLLAIPPSVTGALGLPFGLNGVTIFNQAGRVSNWRQETDAWAVFFQGEWQLTDNLTLTAGARYTEEDKFAVASTRITTDTTGLATPNPSPLLAGALRRVAPTTFDHDFVEKRTTDQVTPGVSLEWARSDDSLYYASYSEGFKSGGFNAVDDQAPDLVRDTPPFTIPGDGWRYEDETATSFEIGGKHTLLDGAMNFNWSLFTSEYDDQQVSTFVGVGFVVRNAATSEVDGLETEIRWQATDNLFLGANVALLDASYGAFPTAGCTAEQASDIAGGAASSGSCTIRIGADGNALANQDLAGGSLTHAPDYSGSLFLDYNRPFNDTMEWFFAADVNFTDGYLLTGDLDPLDFQDSFQKLNVRAGMRGENWEFMVFGRNITDEETAAGGFDVPLLSGGHAIYTDPGEIYGARISYSF